MTAKRALYSLVQYLPDVSRGEVANVGVALYVPETGQVRVQTSDSFLRVRKFFRPDERTMRRIESGVQALKHRLTRAERFESEVEFERFITARADAVRLSLPRLVLVSDADRELSELFAELVGDTERVRRRRPVLPRPVEEVFRRLRPQGKVWHPRSIMVPTVGKRFAVAAAFQNGVTNYVRPESLADGNPQSKLPELGFHGELIYRHPIGDKAGKLVVMSAVEGADPEVKQKFRRTLEEFHVRFVPYREADRFAEEVEQTAH